MSEYSGVVKFSADLRQGTQTDQNCPPTAPRKKVSNQLRMKADTCGHLV